ncbi:MAG: hypothetical protein ACR2OV_03040 [Hyphomicrobiaceae bacterium]
MTLAALSHDLHEFRQREGMAAYVLMPGEIVCAALGVKEPDSRFLLRMFVNLTVYAKLSLLAMMFVF